MGPVSATSPNLEVEGLRRNIDALREICAEAAGGHNIANLNRALSQTATYIEQSHWSHNRGVMFAKDCVVLLWRTNWNTVLVGHAVGYRSTRPHPVAAIAYWIREALFNPSEVIRLGTTERRGAQVAGHSGGGRSETSIRKISGFRSSTWRVTRAMSANRQPLSLPSLSPQVGELVPDRYEYEEDLEEYGDPLGRDLDAVGIKLKFVNNLRCGLTYSGQWTDGQPVVVVAAPVSRSELRVDARMVWEIIIEIFKTS